jgi:hypothetical protein
LKGRHATTRCRLLLPSSVPRFLFLQREFT